MCTTAMAGSPRCQGRRAPHPPHDTRGDARPLLPGRVHGPKVDACSRFVEATGRMAATGSLGEAEALLHGKAGTIISAKHE